MTTGDSKKTERLREEKQITDSSFTIVERAGKASGKYLIECQSKPDSTMVVRIFEYATQIALDENVIVGNRIISEMCHS